MEEKEEFATECDPEVSTDPEDISQEASPIPKIRLTDASARFAQLSILPAITFLFGLINSLHLLDGVLANLPFCQILMLTWKETN